METRKPKSIFISGVNRKTSLKDIFKNKSTEGVSIILEKQAKNTRENALEINTWLKSNKVQEILLITSDYHMYRSIVELRHLNDGLKIYPCSVKSEFNFNFVRNCAKEFHKVIYIYVKRLLEKF
jgi:uncharacterized SAM-binding protein YcdF (DUF218 family)